MKEYISYKKVGVKGKIKKFFSKKMYETFGGVKYEYFIYNGQKVITKVYCNEKRKNKRS